MSPRRHMALLAQLLQNHKAMLVAAVTFLQSRCVGNDKGIHIQTQTDGRDYDVCR
jgi:hypothetical protein